MKYSLITASLLTLCLPFSAQAADPLSFYPSGGWNVGDTCAVSGAYNNGYVITMAGTGDALSIDFKQAVFTARQDYTVALTVGGSSTNLPATAENESVLTINLSGQANIAKAIITSAFFDTDIEGNAFRFFTTGLAQKAIDVKTCQNPAIAAQAPVVEKEPVAKEVPVVEDDIATATVIDVPVGAPADNLAPITREATPDLPAPDSFDETPVSEAETMPLDPLPIEETLPEIKQPEATLATPDWNLEKATMRFQEAERQLKELGMKLQKERAQCRLEQEELEAMLFDPQISEQRQIAELAKLEDQLLEAKEELENQRIRYEERIKILESQQQ
jgi:hypothetical protein